VLGDGDGGADLDTGLDGLDDVLRGGYGAAPTRFRLVWAYAAAAHAALGYPEMVRQLTARLRDCPPNVLIKTAWALRAALRGEGPTAYDELVARVRAHPNVTLVLRDGGGAEGRA